MNEDFKKSITIRQCTFEDCESVEKIVSDVGWRMPKHTISTMFKVNPSQFLVAEIMDENVKKVIGCITTTRVSTQVSYRYVSLYAVNEEYRKQGVGKLLWSKMIEEDRDAKLCLLSVPEMIPVYQKIGFTENILKYVYYKGLVNLANLTVDVEEITIKPYSEDLFHNLNLYDTSVLQFNRENYLKQWVNEEETLILIAVNGSEQVVGNIALSPPLAGFSGALCQAFYADTPDIAETLFYYSVSKHRIAKENGILVRALKCNGDAKNLFEKVGLEIEKEAPLLATGHIAVADCQKIYGISSHAFYNF